MKYDVDYFIKKFQAIPQKKWCTGEYVSENGSKKCAGGHCGMGLHDYVKTDEYKALISVFSKGDITIICEFKDIVMPTAINDGNTKEYQQKTPKQRILAALYDIKKMQEPKIETKDKPLKTVYVAVPVSITEQELILS